ncbi:MAG: hypothetical protein D6690_02365 [Nitrospirae bacterium]|nr:MAG: hypothetical protein D6690_02365 [Nitrospirota bacterium]
MRFKNDFFTSNQKESRAMRWLFSGLVMIVLVSVGSPWGHTEELPSGFVLGGVCRFTDHEPNNVGQGIPSIEIGPDGKLWLFEPFIHVRGDSFAPGQVQVLDPVDGIFCNGNDVLSSRFGSTRSGAIFLPDGRLLMFAAKWPSAILRDAVDGMFFNGNDREDTVQWPFGSLETVGTPEPSPAALGPSGILYFPVPMKNQLAVFDPQDGDLASQQFSFRLVNLPRARFGERPMGIAFNAAGHLFLVSRRFVFQDAEGRAQHRGPVLIGIDPGDDKAFFTDDDRMTYYDILKTLAQDAPNGRPPLIIDIAFDHDGALLLFDARYERLYRFVPALETQNDSPRPLSVIWPSFWNRTASSNGR